MPALNSTHHFSYLRHRPEKSLVYQVIETYNTNSVDGGTRVEDKKGFIEGQSARPPGFIKLEVRQKATKANGQKPRKLETAFGATNADMSVYDNFVKQAVSAKKKKAEAE